MLGRGFMAELLAHDVKLEEGFASREQYGRLYWPPQGMLDYSCGIRGRRNGDSGGIQISNGNGFFGKTWWQSVRCACFVK